MKLPFILVLSIVFLSCSLNHSGDQLTVEEQALIALMVNDYVLKEQLANTGSLEADDLNDEAGAISASSSETGSSTARAIISTTEDTYLLDDGTELVIKREIDDSDTSETTSDDILTVSRSYYFDSQLWKTEEINRPLKPEADWEIWDNGRIVQEGSLTVLIGTSTVATGSLQALWSLESDEVYLEELHKSSFNIATNIKRVTDIIFSGDETTQTISRYYWNGSELVEISVFTAEIIEIGGETYTKLLNDDGSYILIKQKCSPQVREHYDSAGNLWMVETIGKNGGLRTEVTREFYEDGLLVSTKVVNISYKMEEDSVTITKKVDSGSTRFSISITESGEGYLIDRKGTGYYIEFTDTGSVLIYSETGEFLAEITTAPDDSAIVNEPDGTTTVVGF